MYGNRFTREYGDSAPDAWRVAIGHLRDYELSRGLRNLLNAGSGSPPTLPQFNKACRQQETDGPDRNHSPAQLTNPAYDEPVWMHAQRCMFAYLWNKGAVSGAALKAMIEVKARIVAQYRGIIADDPSVTGKDIKVALFKAWEPLWRPRTAAEQEHDLERFRRTGFAAPKPGSDKGRDNKFHVNQFSTAEE